MNTNDHTAEIAALEDDAVIADENAAMEIGYCRQTWLEMAASLRSEIARRRVAA